MFSDKVNRWIAEYEAQGLAEDIIEGRIKGRIEEAAKIFSHMKKEGMSIAEISNLTGFSEDEIRHLI